MHIILNNSSIVPIYEQLVEQIKGQIISGALRENEVLPSVRVLSGELRISALTVKKAYDRLEEEGFVVTVHGKGTYVKSADLRFLGQDISAYRNWMFAFLLSGGILASNQLLYYLMML